PPPHPRGRADPPAARRGPVGFARGRGPAALPVAGGQRLPAQAGRLPRVRSGRAAAGRVLAPAQRAAPGAAEPPVTPTGLIRLLLVEDSPSDAKLLLHSLRRGGWKIESRRVEDDPALRAAQLEG